MEICRAKRISDGQWIEGNLIKLETDRSDADYVYYIIPEKTFGCWCKSGDALKFISPCYDVYSKTICQYIGVRDRNDRKIFKGDIVRREVFGNVILGEVVWFDVGFCGFYLKYKNEYYPMGKDEHTGKSNDEVIGNVYDNPKLCKKY